MELPHIGEHCQEITCKILDFLPFKCDSCKKVFCKDHIHYSKHNCDQSNYKKKDFQVPLCPLCNEPVPYKRNELPDIVMSAHIDRDCKSDPAEERRKVFTNKCSLKGCKQKELIPFNCHKCRKNYCIRHRHENDHNCNIVQSLLDSASNMPNSSRNDLNQKRLFFFQKQQEKIPASINATSSKSQIKPQSMSESEQLEYAIKLSLMESSNERKQTNEIASLSEDESLAKALAESEREYNKRNSNNNESKENCSMS